MGRSKRSALFWFTTTERACTRSRESNERLPDVRHIHLRKFVGGIEHSNAGGRMAKTERPKYLVPAHGLTSLRRSDRLAQTCGFVVRQVLSWIRFPRQSLKQLFGIFFGKRFHQFTQGLLCGHICSVRQARLAPANTSGVLRVALRS